MLAPPAWHTTPPPASPALPPVYVLMLLWLFLAVVVAGLADAED